MATIRNRNGKWQARKRRNGHTPGTRSFPFKRDATRWARQMEADLDATVFAVDLRVLDRTTMRNLLTRYRDKVTPAKRRRASRNKPIDGFHRETWADNRLSTATPRVFSHYRHERLRDVAPDP